MDLGIYFVYKRDSLDILSCQHIQDDIPHMDYHGIRGCIHKLRNYFQRGNEHWHHKVTVHKDLELEDQAVVLSKKQYILIKTCHNSWYW